MTGHAALSDTQIAACFNAGLGRRFHVRLVGGATEPLYEPGTGGRQAVIRYTRDYAASALHELAHWCIAGARRRQLADYGYWYRPPPRTDSEQAAFFKVELPVQALECRLATAAGLSFRVSVDDLDRDHSATHQAALDEFEHQVLALAAADQAVRPVRARQLETDLAAYRLQVAA